MGSYTKQSKLWENCFSYIVLKTLDIWLLVAGEVAAYCGKSPAPNATAEFRVTFQTSEIVQYSEHLKL